MAIERVMIRFCACVFPTFELFRTRLNRQRMREHSYYEKENNTIVAVAWFRRELMSTSSILVETSTFSCTEGEFLKCHFPPTPPPPHFVFIVISPVSSDPTLRFGFHGSGAGEMAKNGQLSFLLPPLLPFSCLFCFE